MPTYQFECQLCGAVQEHVRRIADRDDPVHCPCEAQRAAAGALGMKRVILTAPMGMPDIKPYMAVAGDMAGKPITSRRDHREFLKRNNFREAGDAKAPEKPLPFRKIVSNRDQVIERRETVRRALRHHVPLDVLRKTT